MYNRIEKRKVKKMCQAKSQGGRRCAGHAVKDYVTSIASKRATKESVTTKAEDVIISPVGKTYFEEKGQELVSVGAYNAEQANRNAAFLKAAKFHQTELAPKPVSTVSRPEMDYMSETEKAEYSKFASDEQRKEWWDNKAKEDKAIMEQSAKEWRNDPSAYYDRLSMPSEHADLVNRKDIPEEYLRIIATTTLDKNVRRNAIKNYASKKGVSPEVAEADFGIAEYEIDKQREDYIKEMEAEKRLEDNRNEFLKEKAKGNKRGVNKPSLFKRIFKAFW